MSPPSGHPPSGHPPSGQPPSGPSRDSSRVVRSAPLSRLAELAPLALASATEDRRTIVLSLLADLLRRSASHDLFLAEVIAGEPSEGGQIEGRQLEGRQVVAAAIAIRTADDSASLVAAHALSAAESSGNSLPATGYRHLLGHLLGHLHQCLAEAGVTFIQAMREAEVEQTALVSCGYQFLATLDYLVAARRVSLCSGSEPNKELRSVPYETFFRSLENGVPQDEVSQHGAREGLVALIDATYVDSLDCPQLEQFRSAAAMVDCYRRPPAYDPRDWQILVGSDGRPLGCLLATAHPASGSLEITYMGLIPEARHQGSAGAILERAWEIADRHGLPQLTLAVDRANHPAIKLYQRHGFEVLMSETVWGRSLGSEREISPRGEIEPTRTPKES